MRIIVFSEPGLPTAGLDINIADRLREIGMADIQVVGLASLLTDGVQGDVFCNAHGEVYPIDLEPILMNFLRAGGGVLHLGGAPFEMAMEQTAAGWQQVVRTFGDLRNHQGPGALDRETDVFRAQLGLMTYAPDFPFTPTDQLQQTFDPDLVGCAPCRRAWPQVGITCATTIPLFVAQPDLYLDDHRAYQGKPLCRESHCAGLVTAPDGTALLTSLLLTKSWGNPYQVNQHVSLRPWAIFTGIIETADDIPEGLLPAMLRWLATPVTLPPIELDLPTLHPGETVTPHVRWHGALPDGWRITASQRALRTVDMRANGPYPPWQPCAVKVQDDVASLSIQEHGSDTLLHAVRVALIDDQGVMRDYVESAVVIWRPEWLADAPCVTANGAYFDIRTGEAVQRASWVAGTNWQDRHQFAWTWHNPNPLRIAQDAREMAQAGMLVVRPHYFFPGWMRTVPGEVYRECCPERYADFSVGSKLSERHLRAIEAHVMLFNSAGLVLMPTLYTNVCPTMGNAEQWMNTSRLVAVPGLRSAQCHFAQQVMARFGALPGLIWDLCNEVETAMAKVGDWVRDLQPSWGATGQMVGVGTFHLAQNMVLGEAVDWHSIHVPCCRVTEEHFHSGKPTLLQEAWVPTPATHDGEEDLEHYLHRGISWTLRLGGAGFMPWNWNMMLPNWRAGGSFVEYWDNELGCAVHGDATPRRGQTVLRNWARFLQGLSFDQRAGAQVVFLYPHQGLEGGGITEYIDLLYRLHIPFRAVNDVDFAAFDTGETRLVIVPYFGVGYREATWWKLQEFVESGGTSWAHTDSLQTDERGALAPQRDIPLLGGVQSVGSGTLHWCLGWNAGSQHPLSRLEALLETMPLTRLAGDVLPLVNGMMRFTERLSSDERAMKTDWGPSAKLPECRVVQAVEVANAQGQLERGWSGEGQPFSVDGVTLWSPSSLFVWREAQRQFLVAGNEVSVVGSSCSPRATLVTESGDEYSLARHWEHDSDTWTLRLYGWERRHRVRIVINE